MLMPFPHRNTLNFFGMGPKTSQFIWREEQGTFTSYNKYGKLNMWSAVTGKIIKNSKVLAHDFDGRRDG